MDQRRIEDQCLRASLEAAIEQAERDAAWYRGGWRRGDPAWADLRAENLTILRKLRRVYRNGLAIAAPIVEREDAITAAKAEALRAGDHHVGLDAA